MFNQEDFSDDEVENWLEELEDAYDSMERFAERRVGDNGYFSEVED